MARSAGGPVFARALAATVLAAGAALASSPVAAGELPQQTAPIHEGVKSCAGSPCHGNPAGVGKVVLQNEYPTWQAHDRHAKAYEVLLDERSKRIARNLGLPTAAHEAPLCLNCHADFVPPERRGKQFVLEDGVGCEACHGGSGGSGGAEGWLTAHTSGSNDRKRWIELGLYPSDEPVARAELCLSCHFGTSDKFVTHRLMGAGHPRMSFELDTFGQVQPAHYRVDDDYAQRGKQAPEPARTWAVGQGVLVRETLAALQDSRGRHGFWPEFVLFDCHACHHPMSEQRWAPRRSTGLQGQPGVIRFNDSSLLMLQRALSPVDPAAAERLKGATKRLHAALSLGASDPAQAAAAAQRIVENALPALVAWQPSVEGTKSIAAGLVADGLSGQFLDYAAAEQAAMALQSLTATLHGLGSLDDATLEVADRDLQALLAATQNDERYRSASITPLLRRLESRLR
jgi:hypothetical protein